MKKILFAALALVGAGSAGVSATTSFPDWYKEPAGINVADATYRSTVCTLSVQPTCAYYLTAPNVVEDKIQLKP